MRSRGCVQTREAILRCQLLLVVGLVVSGCVCLPQGDTKVVWLTPNVLTNLNRGISLEELKVRTGCKPQPQFTARLGTNEASCVKLSFVDRSWSFYFYFTNGNLAAIKDPPKTEYETKRYWRGTPWLTPKPVDSETRLARVINAPDLATSDLINRIGEWEQARSMPRRQSLNMLPVYVIMLPFEPLRLPKVRRAKTETASLAERFDPGKIRLGMTTNETQAIFGEPDLRIKGLSNRWEHVYGSKLSPFAPATTPSVWVSAVFPDGEATRIFSHDFFDKRLVNGVP